MRRLVLAALLLAAACGPRHPVVVEGHAPSADPAEVARQKSLYAISMLEISRPFGPGDFGPFLDDKDPSIRASAARGVGRAGEALAFAGGDAAPFVDLLLSHAADPSPDVRDQIAWALGLIGPAATGKIEAAFASEPVADVRARWVRAAGRIVPLPPAPAKDADFESAPSSPSAQPELDLLATALGDEALAPSAGTALGIYGIRCERGGTKPALPDATLAALRTRFNRSLGPAREPYAYALFRLHLLSTTGDLRNGLVDPDSRVRALCARGLGSIKGTHARREVSRLLRDSDVWTRCEAARSLAGLEDADSSAAVDLVEMLEHADPPRVPDRNLGLASPHAAVAACDALGELGFRDVAEPLRARLGSEDPYLFASASAAYVKVAGVEALPDLADTLQDIDAVPAVAWRYRMSIAAALAGLPKPKKAADPDTGAGAISTAIPADAEDLFKTLLADGDLRVQAAALDSYAEIAGPSARRRLVAALTSSSDVSIVGVAADRLAGLEKDAGPDAGPALVATFSRWVETKPDLAAGLVADAAKLGGDAMLPLLEKGAVSPSNALMLACDKALRAAGKTPPARSGPPEDAPSEADWLAARDLSRMTLHTPKGDVIVELASDVAPVNIRHFAALAKAGFFDGVGFHRVVPAFVVQGGDPHGDGNGGPEFTVACELSDLAYDRGTVGIALAGRDTGGSQFFFTLTPQPHLESNYTIIGRVVHGMDVVDRLSIGDPVTGIELQ